MEARQLRAITTQFTTREIGEVPHIEGYFAVFNSEYQIAPGMIETIAPGAFANSLATDDIRALTNHDTTLVLGRNTAGTLELREDDRGLWGDIAINPNDGDAANTWARVQRGDVSQCSIGFEIISEDSDILPDGSMRWTIREVKLYEVSVCTFPAYEETNVSARSKERDDIKARQLEAWKNEQKARLKNGTKSADAPQKD